MSDHKNACPHCGEVVTFDSALAGRATQCPKCQQLFSLEPPKTVPRGKILPGQYRGLALLLLIVGAITFVSAILFCWTAVPGVILMAIGAALNKTRQCSECGNKVAMSSKLCPTCRCQF
jgi:hypothetical protein